jgi:hypothetical protein
LASENKGKHKWEFLLHEQATVTAIKFSICDVHEPIQATVAQVFDTYIREAVPPNHK